MINFFKSWCEGIIVAVVISIIIEAILPEGNNKKYVKVVVGIYIIFTILSPVLGKVDYDIDFGDVYAGTTIETSSVDSGSIKSMYLSGIKETLKNNIEENFGYSVKDLEIKYDENYEAIESVTLEIQPQGISKIEKVQIGNQTQNEENNNYEDVKKYISENYEIDVSKILVN